MGSFFMRQGLEAGTQMLPLDFPFALSDAAFKSKLADLDMLLLCVPVTAMEEVCRVLGPLLVEPTILADICSVKTMPLRVMRKYYSGPIVGTHPLFGPAPEEDDPCRAAITPEGTVFDRPSQHVFDWLELTGLAPFRSTVEEHDRAMAFLQGLNFAGTAAYLAAQSGDLRIKDYLTPSFKRRLVAATKMFSEDAELFTTIFEANPYSGEAIRNMRGYLNLAACGEMELLVSRASWWWD